MRVRLARSLSLVKARVKSWAGIRKVILRAQLNWFVAAIFCGVMSCLLLLLGFIVFGLAIFAFARIFWKPRRRVSIL
jgi:hypothetical protein